MPPVSIGRTPRETYSQHLQSLSTNPSKTLKEATRKVVSLYREALRAIPRIQADYSLDLPKAVMVKRIRREFDKNTGVTDKAILDMLVFKGKVELEEYHHLWKQNHHALEFFEVRQHQMVSSPHLSEERTRKREERREKLAAAMEQAAKVLELDDETVISLAYPKTLQSGNHEEIEKIRNSLKTSQSYARDLRKRLYFLELKKVGNELPTLVAEDFEPGEGQYLFNVVFGEFNPQEWDFEKRAKEAKKHY